ncbi:MAG TPA: SpaA isopeptide-forming pilin-related protein, partial [bacterium]|nr:SpaA isopeptide-forming pilin-related protein [bacterium]
MRANGGTGGVFGRSSVITQSADAGGDRTSRQATIRRAPWSSRKPAIGSLTLAITLLVGLLYPTPAEAAIGPFNATNGVLDTSAGIMSRSDRPSGAHTDDSYTQGAKDSDLCPTVRTGGVPPKDDLSRFHADISVDATGTTYLYLAWERFPHPSENSPPGSANISFEVSQSGGTCANGVNPPRTRGDLLVMYDFEAGANRPVLRVREWSGSAWVNERTFDVLPGGIAEASINANRMFGELAINLNAAGLIDPGQCFASAILKSRASFAFNAELKDLIRGIALQVCGDIAITKVNDATPPARLAGAVFTLFTNVNNAVGVPVVPARTCTTGSNGTCTISDVGFGTYWVVETRTPAGHTPAPPQQVVVRSATTRVNLTFVNPRVLGNIAITKVNDATPPARLAGAVFTLFTNVNNAVGVPVVPARTCT